VSNRGERISVCDFYKSTVTTYGSGGNKLWERKLVREMIQGVEWSPDGVDVAVLLGSGKVLLLSGKTGDVVSTHSFSGMGFAYIRFSPGGGWLLVMGTANDFYAINLHRPGSPPMVGRGHTSGVICFAYSPDGQRVVTGSSDGTVRVWDAKTLRPLLRFESVGTSVTCVCFNREGTRIFAGDSVGRIHFYDAPKLDSQGTK
jgi:WD40 repeat protein